MKKRSGGRALVESLSAHGVKKVFCVPGESYLDALDALLDTAEGGQGIRVVTCRHESGAAFMAEAYAKLTGHPGICFVTRGPGACNAAIGIHTAMQDSTPVILLVGQVARADLGREAFQEIDYRVMFAPPVTKWAVQVDKADDLPHVMQQAFEIAASGRPGPVVVALPEDVLTDLTAAPVLYPEKPAHFAPTGADVLKMKEMLRAAKRPLMLLGGGGWTDGAAAMIEDFCARAGLPAATSFRRQDAFRNDHDCYAGSFGFTVDARLTRHLAEADLVIAVGTRIGDVTTQGYTLMTPPVPKQSLIHVYPDSTELNRVYRAALAIHSSVTEFAKAAAEMDVDGGAWERWRAALRADYLDWITVRSRDKFALDLDGVMEDVVSELPGDALIAIDVGNFSGWPQRFIPYKRPMRQLASTAGAMGYGFPAAVAAAVTRPERTVVCFSGDGGFLMTGSELATAVKEGARIVSLVFNNGMYGTIRMHQEKHYPGRVSATDLVNPDFAALARSHGAEGETVSRTEDFLPVFRRALKAKGVFVIELRMDPEQITTTKRLAEIGA